ncbi:hypothetical protein MASR1M36_08790 [Candidatus Cloacimonadaceae bacterium]
MNDEILKELKVLNRLLAMRAIIDVEKGRKWDDKAKSFLLSKSSELIAILREENIADQMPQESE